MIPKKYDSVLINLSAKLYCPFNCIQVILMFKRSKTLPKCNTEWYDPVTKVRKNAPGMNDCRQAAGLGVIRDQFVFAVGGMTKSSCQSATMIDASLQSPCWVPMANMLISRKLPGVGVLNNCIYVVSSISNILII